MAGVDFALNGIPLDSTYCRVTQGSTLFAGVSVSRNKVSAPFRHGTVPDGMPPSFEERSVTLKVSAFGHDGFHLDSARLARLCMAPMPVLSRTVNGVTQQAVVELASLEADDGGTVLDRLIPFTAVFAMPGVWWRDTTTYDRPLAANTTAILWPASKRWTQSYWTRWEGAANNSASLLADFTTMWMGEANNSPSLLIPLADGIQDGMFGDAPLTDLVIRCPKGVTSVTVTDPVTGSGVIWTGKADATRYTYLDCGNATAWQTDDDHQWTGPDGFVDVTGGLDYPAAGMLQCWPAPTDNSYKLTTKLTGSTDGLLAHCRRAWW
ncbi:hypothetical protein JS533_001715 [Bifidobacterium amazonense]|uniref:Minor tail protein n=1 Tax=Bifidobacterium amazonense TaxID=2809027 RepID=A0ABS9VSV8_9BIFI|nr:hypothetical protein [Bifidobacterium amazonense]MCH9275006.1 hypothetical protein [Bifidobacterium amazonense]